jgi:GNAT superfamily N-acetyltransferase
LFAFVESWCFARAICDNPDMPNKYGATQRIIREKGEDNLPPVTIRQATEADAPLLYECIRKLAEYGDIADEVTATEADVRAALSGPRPVAEAVIAYVGDEPAGFAMYHFSFASFLGKTGIYIEDFFVEQAHRNRGIGKLLLVHLAKLARERGCGRLEWSVLNWNERAMEFYQDFGAVAMDEWTTFRLSGEALERLATQGGI